MPALVLLAVALSVAGCSRSSEVDVSGGSSDPSASPAPTAAPTASPSATGFPEEAAILSQYRAFFASLAPLSKQESNARFEAMKKLAVDPELTRVMGGIAASHAAGEVLYGVPVSHPVINAVQGGTAQLTDCQDSSMNGRMKEATGKVVTVGRKNDLAKVTMQRGTDGAWRVATIEYAPAGSCAANT